MLAEITDNYDMLTFLIDDDFTSIFMGINIKDYDCILLIINFVNYTFEQCKNVDIYESQIFIICSTFRNTVFAVFVRIW